MSRCQVFLIFCNALSARPTPHGIQHGHLLWAPNNSGHRIIIRRPTPDIRGYPSLQHDARQRAVLVISWYDLCNLHVHPTHPPAPTTSPMDCCDRKASHMKSTARPQDGRNARPTSMEWCRRHGCLWIFMVIHGCALISMEFHIDLLV